MATLPRFRFSVALTGAAVALLLAELGVRAIGAVGLLPPEPGWLSAEYPTKVAAMEALASTGGAGVVVLGSSVAGASIDPTGLGPTALGDRPAYNAGLLGPTPPIVADWSAGWVEPLLAPDVVVVVVSSRDLNANAPYLREHERRWSEGMWVRARLGTESLAERAERWLTERSELLRYRSALRRPISGVLKASRPALTAGGLDVHMRELPYQIDEVISSLQADEPTALADFAIDAHRMAALRTLIQRLDDDGVRVIVLDAPTTIDYAPMHPGGLRDYLDYRQAITDLAEDVGVELVLSGLWELDHMADPLHVNGRGSQRLTALVDAVLSAAPTSEGGLVDLTVVPGASELVGPTDPSDPAVPGPASIPMHGLPGSS